MQELSQINGDKRAKIKDLEVVVTDVIRESPDSATLVLFVGNDTLNYKPGHFLTINPSQFKALDRFVKYFEDIKGKREPARAYSLSSAPHEKYLAITVKEERYVSEVTKYPPLLSPFLVWRTQPGTKMVVTGFTGPYTLPDDIGTRTNHIVHICAGSGIVPNMSIIKHVLHNNIAIRNTLIYGNRSYEDIIFRKELAELASKYPKKLKVINALSREENESYYSYHIRKGRVNYELINELIEDPSSVEVYICGPGTTKQERDLAKQNNQELKPRFLESTIAALHSVSVPRDKIHKESYG